MKITQLESILFNTQQYCRDQQMFQVEQVRPSTARLPSLAFSNRTNVDQSSLQQVAATDADNFKRFFAVTQSQRNIDQEAVCDWLLTLQERAPKDLLFDPDMPLPDFSTVLNDLDALPSPSGYAYPALSKARSFPPGVIEELDSFETLVYAATSTDINSRLLQPRQAAPQCCNAPSFPALALASDCLKDIRSDVYKAGSRAANKRNIRKHGRVSEEERLEKASAEVDRLRKLKDGPTRCNAALHASGHVCDELAEAAYAYLEGASEPLTIINSKGHTFLAVGALPAGQMDDDMTNWPASIAICDPWLNIACAAPDYPSLFMEKMEKWAFAGKEIYDKRGWFHPQDRTWTEGVIDGVKRRKVI